MRWGNMDKFAKASESVSLSIVMPAFNETNTVVECLNSLISKLNATKGLSRFEVIVVESNSTDGTKEKLIKLAEYTDFTLVLQDEPKGKGFAVREGLLQSTGDVICIFDADLEYDPADIEKLLLPILSGNTSFVLGSRHRKGAMRVFSDKPLLGKIMNLAHWVFTELFNIVYITRLTDPFTMYKLFRKEAIEGLIFTSNRFDFDWELVAKLRRNGSRPVEIPIHYESRDFQAGKKVRFFRDPATWMVALIKFRFARIRRE